ncbi:carboxypeptidase-like regulatory domain-containing protein [candidate division KSB1 bacterium]|nr:carboxypeptidase-like regulatory domain-containing protein [candidate division KSB1 bacterium]
MKYSINLLITVLLLFTPLYFIQAGTTGKISGKIIDAETKEPLPGANIYIASHWVKGKEIPLEILKGTSSDLKGNFFILNVAPGLYNVTARVIGYKTVTMTKVYVNIDRTTLIDFELDATVLEAQEVVVVADREKIRKDVSNSMSAISAIELENAPKLSFADMLTMEAGIESDAYGVTIRGGTEKEVGYMVDGVSMKDSRTDRPYTNINTELIEEVQLITGGFNAEYGEARSGIVNIVSKRSKDKYTGSINVRYSPAALKHFGPNMWTKDNWWDYGRFQHFDAIEGPEYVNELGEKVKSWHDEKGNNIDRDKDGVADFLGWNQYAKTALNQYKLTPDDCFKLWKYQHRNEEFANELGVDPVLIYGDQPDYDIQTSFGGPLWPFGKIPVLSDIDFFGGYTRRYSAYTYQLSRDGFVEENAQLVLNYQITNNIKIGVLGLYGESHACGWFLGEDHAYINNPGYIIQNVYGIWSAQGYPNVYAVDNNSNFIDWYRTNFSISLNHILSPSTFYDLKIQRTSITYKANPPTGVKTETYIDRNGAQRHQYYSEFSLINTEGDTIHFPTFPEGYDYYRYPEISGGFTTDQNGYYMHNLLDGWGYDDSYLETWTVKTDLTSQINAHHQLKTGFIFNTNNVVENRWAAFPRGEDKFGNLVGFSGTHFNVQFWEGGTYIQDKIEYPGFVMNIGVRFDFYQAESPMPDTWNNPFRPDLYGHFMRDTFFDSLSTISADVPLKWAISPRLGIAHPISENSKLYFNYGRFTQSPTTHNLYWLRYGGVANGGRMEFVGNPWLPLPKTTSYEVGFEQDIFEYFRLNLNGYYKDSRNQPQFVFYNPGTVESLWFSYQDYSYWTSKGIEARFTKKAGSVLSGFLNFSYFLTTYGTTGPTLVRPDDEDLHNKFIAQQASSLAKRTFEPVIRAKAGFYINSPERFGPEILFFRPFENWRFNWIVKWRLGSRFHWDPTGQLDPALLNYKWRDYRMVDLKIDRDFKVAGTDVSLYIDIFNIFNIKNFNITDFGEAIYEGVDYYQAPGSASYTFWAYGKDSGDEFDRYMTRIEQTGKHPGDEVEEAYMPKRKALTYLFPRDIWIGLRFSF